MIQSSLNTAGKTSKKEGELMRTLEDYWKDFENFGFIKHTKVGRTDYILSKEKGEGGFSILGDISSAMATISDCTLYTPRIISL